jgi:hypothetical protein
MLSLVERASSGLNRSGRGPPPVLAERAEGIRSRVGVRLVVPARNHDRQRVDRPQEQVREVGAAVVARLGDIGLEDRPCGGNQRLPRRFVARPRNRAELRTRIEAAAVERGMSVRDYAVAALQAALAGNRGGPAATSDEWSGAVARVVRAGLGVGGRRRL